MPEARAPSPRRAATAVALAARRGAVLLAASAVACIAAS